MRMTKEIKETCEKNDCSINEALNILNKKKYEKSKKDNKNNK